MPTAEPESFTFEYYDYYDYNETDLDLVYLCDSYESHVFGAVFTPVLYSLAFIFSLIGNALVLWVLVRYEKLRNVTDIFILNLVISDLLFAFSLPFWAVDHTFGWVFGKAMCKVMTAIFFIGYYSGISLLTLMTVDRYFIVVHPVSAVRVRKLPYAVAVSSAVWAISVSVTIPEMIFSDTVAGQNEICTSNYPPESARMWRLLGCYQQNILFFLIPFVVIVFCYCRILNTVIRCKAREKHKTVKVIFCIVLVFFVCWAPYNVVIFLYSLVEHQVPEFLSCEMENGLIYAYFISRNLAYTHCCLNPFFYVFVGSRFRKHLTQIARRHLPFTGIQKQPKYRRRSRPMSSSNEYSNASSTFSL
ncbi:chemokine XC receptor 1-like [Mustelus asterias]